MHKFSCSVTRYAPLVPPSIYTLVERGFWEFRYSLAVLWASIIRPGKYFGRKFAFKKGMKLMRWGNMKKTTSNPHSVGDQCPYTAETSRSSKACQHVLHFTYGKTIVMNIHCRHVCDRKFILNLTPQFTSDLLLLGRRNYLLRQW